MSSFSTKWDDTDTVSLIQDDENRVLVHFHGATILSWICNGQEMLFLSEKAVFDNKKAIRGGIPIVFPCFGPWTNGPQHGFARIMRWKLEDPPTKDESSCRCSLSLEQDENTLKSWDYRFKLVLTIELRKESLNLTLTVQNTDTKPFSFTTLMHTYFACSDIESTTVLGLKDKTYVDKLQDSKTFVEDREDVKVDQNYDRVYQNCNNGVTLKPNSSYDINVAVHNMSDIVVWNPWIEKAKAMSDFDDEEYNRMLCVEAGAVSQNVTIKEGQSLTFSQTLTITSRL